MIVDNARAAAELLAPHFTGEPGMAVAVLHLDPDRRLIRITFAEMRAGGGEDRLPIREILAAALKVGAAAMIVAQSREGDDAAPTDVDRAATRRLADAVAAVGLRLTDHLIFAGEECRSFRGLGLL
jgi:DNA repair protein RadC